MKTFPKKLLSGYRSFMATRYVGERERYTQLADSGQKPDTLVIACCDSRAAPETVFNSGPGELFVIRNVANLVPPYTPDGEFHATSAALEFAVQALRVKHIVVMGHGRCGGISAALQKGEPLSPGDFIGKWISMLEPLADQLRGNKVMTASECQTALERVSVRNSLANLLTFPCVKILHERGKLTLHGAWFDISTGELWVMETSTGDFGRPVDHLKLVDPAG